MAKPIKHQELQAVLLCEVALTNTTQWFKPQWAWLNNANVLAHGSRDKGISKSGYWQGSLSPKPIDMDAGFQLSLGFPDLHLNPGHMVIPYTF